MLDFILSLLPMQSSGVHSLVSHVSHYLDVLFRRILPHLDYTQRYGGSSEQLGQIYSHDCAEFETRTCSVGVLARTFTKVWHNSGHGKKRKQALCRPSKVLWEQSIRIDRDPNLRSRRESRRRAADVTTLLSEAKGGRKRKHKHIGFL